MRFLSIALLLLLPTSALAQYEGVCRVSVAGPSSKGHGSGVLISPHHVLTCRHLFDGRKGQRVYVRFLNVGKTEFDATEHWTDEKNDVALLFFEESIDLPTYQVSDKAPEFDSTLTYSGFGSSSTNTFRLFKGKYFKNSLNHNGRDGSGICDSPWRSGDSGGPVFFKEKVIGVGWGSTSTEMYFTRLPAIKRLLNKHVKP